MAPWGTHHHAGLPPLSSSPAAGFGWPTRGGSVPSAAPLWQQALGAAPALLPLGGAPPRGAHYRFAKGERPGNSGEALNGEPAFGNWERPRRPLLPVWPVAARWVSKKIDQHHNFTPASLLIPQPFVPRTEKSESNNFILISASQSSQSTGIARIFKHNGSVL